MVSLNINDNEIQKTKMFLGVNGQAYFPRKEIKLSEK
jgi:hypothetical protein